MGREPAADQDEAADLLGGEPEDVRWIQLARDPDASAARFGTSAVADLHDAMPVTSARTHAIDAASGSLADQAQAENALTGALKSLVAVAEAYPDLKANANFLALQEELTSTEDRIAYARQFFNDTVLSYNTRIQTFPANLLAGMFGFTAREYFDGDPGDAAPVDVRF